MKIAFSIARRRKDDSWGFLKNVYPRFILVQGVKFLNPLRFKFVEILGWLFWFNNEWLLQFTVIVMVQKEYENLLKGKQLIIQAQSCAICR